MLVLLHILLLFWHILPLLKPYHEERVPSFLCHRVLALYIVSWCCILYSGDRCSVNVSQTGGCC